MAYIDCYRDDKGIAHIVALSGGKDSTAMALRLRQISEIRYTYICTPTGNELPEMFDHWQKLAKILGSTIYPISDSTLSSIIESEKMLPNPRARFCTRKLKIEPFLKFLEHVQPAVAYVGLRADEGDRSGANYGGNVSFDLGMLEQRWPLREWGWDINDVLSFLDDQAVLIPSRTDCAACFYQTIGEWWALWRDHLDAFLLAEKWESESGHTFRIPIIKDGVPQYRRKGNIVYIACHRDSWPTNLCDMRQLFEAGHVPKNANQLDFFRQSTCRICTL